MTDRSHVAWRAVFDTATTVAVAFVFVLAWTVEDIPDGARRLTSFVACILFVVFFHEAARSWRRVRADRSGAKRPI